MGFCSRQTEVKLGQARMSQCKHGWRLRDPTLTLLHHCELLAHAGQALHHILRHLLNMAEDLCWVAFPLPVMLVLLSSAMIEPGSVGTWAMGIFDLHQMQFKNEQSRDRACHQSVASMHQACIAGASVRARACHGTQRPLRPRRRLSFQPLARRVASWQRGRNSQVHLLAA